MLITGPYPDRDKYKQTEFWLLTSIFLLFKRNI